MTRVLVIDPQNVLAYTLRAAGYITLQKWEKALSDLNQAIALGEQHAWTYQNRALAHENLGQYDKAIQDLSRSLQITPDDHGSLAHRAWAYLCLNDIEKGIVDLNALLSQNRDDALTRVRRGWKYLEIKNIPAALSDLNYAITQKAELPLAYLNLSALYYQTGNWEMAYSTNTKLFSLHEERVLVDAFFQKGLILLAMKRNQEARTAFAQGKALAEKVFDGKVLDDGMRDLQQALENNQADRNTTAQIFQELKEARGKMKTPVNARHKGCRYLSI
ncbi:MAG: tetratricopeptide repeat protein [Nitrospirota bacterium]